MTFETVPHGSEKYRATVDLRHDVLRKPLGLSLSEEQLEAEANDVHLAAFEGGECMACCVLTPYAAGTVKMRQVAVRPDLQGQGVGSRLVAYFEAVARERGAKLIVLNARDTAVAFYERLGYEPKEALVEVGIPHRHMTKSLV